MTPLEDAPNIGPVLAGRLRAVGIDSLEALRRVGDAAAFARLYARYGVDACGHTRLALAGAVRGVRKVMLPAALKRALAVEVRSYR